MFNKEVNNMEHNGFSLNFCNDTIIPCYKIENEETNKTIEELNFDSSLIYRDKEGFCTKITGSFYKNDEKENENYLIYQDDNSFKYVAPKGDKCSNGQYKMVFNFINIKDTNKNKNNIPNIEWYKIPIPNVMNHICDYSIDISLNFDDCKEYLLVQKFFNDYWVLSGIIFIIIGLYLILLAQNKKATKFVIGTIFGEIFIFTVTCALFSIKYNYLEWCIAGVGIVFGAFIGYFSLGGNRLFRAILSITAGIIIGLISFDIIFLHQNYQLAQILLTDSVLIFAGLFFIIIYLLPDYHYFCDSIIGSYIFIRGISILLHKLGKYARFRELQLLLYLIGTFEFDYANYYFKEQWPIYFVYDIFMIIFMAASMFYYYVKAVGRDDDDEAEENIGKETKLIGNKKSTLTEDDQELE